VALSARADEAGRLSRVDAETKAGKLVLTGPTGRQESPDCVMSVAKWNPELRRQSHWLNAGQ